MAIIKKPFRKVFYLSTLIIGMALPFFGKIFIGNRQDFSQQGDHARNFFSSHETYVGVPDAQADTVGCTDGCADGCDGCTGDSTGDCTVVDGSTVSRSRSLRSPFRRRLAILSGCFFILIFEGKMVFLYLKIL